jgi:16S rRNA A1518/A1519 N6-dimethyltransferase RsmA/KsgA/DIM1 with predicted DNA glycosylase/AP lyase activity
VESSVIHLQPDPARRARAGDLDKLRRVAGALFGHRRKQLAGSLLMGGLVRDRQGAARVLAAIGSADSGRCEDLSPAQFVRLAELLS